MLLYELSLIQLWWRLTRHERLWCLEGDALKIVYALQKDEQLLSMYGTLIGDSEIIMRSFHSWQLYCIQWGKQIWQSIHRQNLLSINLCRKFGWKNILFFLRDIIFFISGMIWSFINEKNYLLHTYLRKKTN